MGKIIDILYDEQQARGQLHSAIESVEQDRLDELEKVIRKAVGSKVFIEYEDLILQQLNRYSRRAYETGLKDGMSLISELR